MSDPYYDKYLKYKNKYNKLKIELELEGGLNSALMNRMSRSAAATKAAIGKAASATSSSIGKAASATSSAISRGSNYIATGAEKLKDNTAAVLALDTYNGAVENFKKSVENHNNSGINKFQKEYDRLNKLKKICDKRRNKIGKKPCNKVPPVTDFNIECYKPLNNNNIDASDVEDSTQ
jgi:hypothetical protein